MSDNIRLLHEENKTIILVRVQDYDSYFISACGRVFRYFTKSFTEMKGTVTYKGYVRFHFTNPSNNFYLQRLVAREFCNPPEDWNELQVRHLDGDSLNNHASNLRWGSNTENVADRNFHRKLHALFNVWQRVNMEEDVMAGFSCFDLSLKYKAPIELMDEMVKRYDEMDWSF